MVVFSVDRPIGGAKGAVLFSTRGGDFEPHLGQDLSIGYLTPDAASVTLYLQESLTAFVQTSEAQWCSARGTAEGRMA